jgi:uncharacterized membrane protein YjfL (UPF0719 family)
VEVIGYCARAAAASRTDSLMPYILQYNMILLPPALFAATIYMCLGRIILLTEATHLSIISPRWLTGIFVTGDIVSFIILGSSSGLTILSTDHPSLATTAKWAVIGGLLVQLVAFALFGITALLFHARIRRKPTAASFQVDQGWTKALKMLYGVSALVIIRSIFRLIEYAGGESGYLLSHEWPLYIFDTLAMLAVAFIFFYVYPSNVVKDEVDHIPLINIGTHERVTPKSV